MAHPVSNAVEDPPCPGSSCAVQAAGFRCALPLFRFSLIRISRRRGERAWVCLNEFLKMLHSRVELRMSFSNTHASIFPPRLLRTSTIKPWRWNTGKYMRAHCSISAVPLRRKRSSSSPASTRGTLAPTASLFPTDCATAPQCPPQHSVLDG